MKEITPLHPDYPELAKRPAYSVTALAKGIGISRDTIHNAIACGELGCEKYGPKNWKIPAPEALRWLKSKRM